MESRPVKAVNPPAPYIGGKRNLAERIIPIIESVPHNTYVEPFIGMGGIFFRRSEAPKVEVINDISRDVITLFRVLQEHYPHFIDFLKFRLTSRVEFDRLMQVDPDTLTDFQRAGRFLYLQKTAYGGKVHGRNFGVSPGRPGRFDVSSIVAELEDIHARLSAMPLFPMQPHCRNHPHEPFWAPCGYL